VPAFFDGVKRPVIDPNSTIVGNPELGESDTARVVGETAESGGDLDWAARPLVAPGGGADN
jgi:hypothetical protein